MTAILHRYAEKELEWTEKIAVMWSGDPSVSEYVSQRESAPHSP